MTNLPLTTFSPFSDCLLTIDGEQFAVSRHAIAMRSRLLATLFEETRNIQDFQDTWNRCKQALGMPDLSFSVLMKALHTGEADVNTLPPRVVDYFWGQDITYGVIVFDWRKNEGLPRIIYVIPRSRISDAQMRLLHQLRDGTVRLNLENSAEVWRMIDTNAQQPQSYKHSCSLDDSGSLISLLQQPYGRVLEIIRVDSPTHPK